MTFLGTVFIVFSWCSGFDVEPYYLTESLGSDMSADNMFGGLNAPSSVMSTRPLQTTSPSESTLDVQVQSICDKNVALQMKTV